MAYTNHAGALWRWRSASELGVDQELKEKFKHLRQPITRPYAMAQWRAIEENATAVLRQRRGLEDYLLSISDEEVAS